jgi:NAD(P)-dependent dehydrogenase (short-subunit alcohol dehydrogenase family)
MDLNGTSAIVTGSASGLGAATARLLAHNGAGVVVADVQDDKGEALAAEIGGVFVHTDVTDTDQIIAAVDTAAGMAPLRGLVCCAGIGWPERTVGKDGEYASAHSLDAYK